MGDEPEIPPSGGQASPTISAEGEEKPRRRPRKPAELKPPGLPTTETGEKVADQLRRKLIEMVDAAALTEANRRRATALDSTDYEAGFDRIAGPVKREKTVAIVADVAGAMGTALMGYATSVYTSTAPDISKGHLAIIGGLALLVTSIILKYGPHGK